MPTGAAPGRNLLELYVDLRDEGISALEHLLPHLWTFYPERLDIDMVLQGCSTVLDLGCGPLSIVRRSKATTYKVGVDIFRRYLLECVRERTHDDLVLCDLTKPCIRPKSFDAVVAFEVLEHMTKEQGVALMNHMESAARRLVVVTTPNGHVEQEEYEGNPYQEHRSSWVADDLRSLGYEVIGLNGLKALRGRLGRVIFKPKICGEWLSFISQVLVQSRPERAFQLMGIKRLQAP